MTVSIVPPACKLDQTPPQLNFKHH
ncbi:unnamed protein product [Spirodela intermedia]|uniref:Uncharacterized protein n=1 Tax=Spirodela intermedia TaxID=51605 RepID=A0A7I8IPX1_SPIIN|nr:unnamed protein product [Spirodela intermedia]CAA6659989.1 unnamed protein product [Spirodela intermedia]